MAVKPGYYNFLLQMLLLLRCCYFCLHKVIALKNDLIKSENLVQEDPKF